MRRQGRQLGRQQVWLRAAAAAAGLAVLLAGCGDPDGPGGQAGSPPATAPTGPAPSSPPPPGPAPAPDQPTRPTQGVDVTDAKLKIVLSTQGVQGSTEQILECVDSRPTDASTVSDPAAACEVLAKSGEAVFFALPDPNRMCTQQYGGPQKARVTGTLDGKPVDKEFSLTDGCRIAEWQAMQPLFGSFGPEV